MMMMSCLLDGCWFYGISTLVGLFCVEVTLEDIVSNQIRYKNTSSQSV